MNAFVLITVLVSLGGAGEGSNGVSHEITRFEGATAEDDCEKVGKATLKTHKLASTTATGYYQCIKLSAGTN